MATHYRYLAPVILLAMISCRTVNTVERADPRATPHVVHDARITTDSSLSQKAAVLQIRETKVGNGLLKIQAEILNRTSSRKRVNYRFDWIDESGMVIDTPLSSWKPLSLAGKESMFISSVAPTPRAVDFRLKLIEASD